MLNIPYYAEDYRFHSECSCVGAVVLDDCSKNWYSQPMDAVGKPPPLPYAVVSLSTTRIGLFDNEQFLRI